MMGQHLILYHELAAKEQRGGVTRYNVRPQDRGLQSHQGGNIPLQTAV